MRKKLSEDTIGKLGRRGEKLELENQRQGQVDKLGRRLGPDGRWLPRNPDSMKEHFFKKFIKDTQTGCWNWIAGKKSGGYGQFYGQRIMIMAHSYSYLIHNGPIPNGIFVCHKCDNTSCVNPSHLFLGTMADNMADMERKGRRSSPRGEDCVQAKLNEDQVREIRVEYSKPEAMRLSSRKLARKYGVTRPAIMRLIKRRAWKHVK